jgi:hypothetical protein
MYVVNSLVIFDLSVHWIFFERTLRFISIQVMINLNCTLPDSP